MDHKELLAEYCPQALAAWKEPVVVERRVVCRCDEKQLTNLLLALQKEGYEADAEVTEECDSITTEPLYRIVAIRHELDRAVRHA